MFVHGDVDHNRLVEFGRRDLVVVSDKDQRAFDRETMGIQLVLVERLLFEILVLMHLALLNVPFLLEFQACRAEIQIKRSSI